MGSMACWLVYQRFGKKYVFCVIKKSGKSIVGWMDGRCGRKEGKSAKIGSSLKMCAVNYSSLYRDLYMGSYICWAWGGVVVKAMRY
jgi:hypothetical protein